MLTNKQVRTALQKSIKKWEGIAYHGKEDHGMDDCALCEMFVVQRDSCDGCPIMEHIGMNCCCGSPYDDWVHVVVFGIKKVTNSASHRQALRMLDFLRMLDDKYFVKGVSVP